VRRHFFQRGKNAVHMFIGINENDDDWQLPTSLDQVRSLDALSS